MNSLQTTIAIALGCALAIPGRMALAWDAATVPVDVIRACVTRPAKDAPNGQIRLVFRGTPIAANPNPADPRCTIDEDPIDWNVTGPSGTPGAGSLSEHYQQYRFDLTDASSHVLINLPVQDSPVRIDVSTSGIVVDCGNDVIETLGPAAFSGVWTLDSASERLSVIGDNQGDGVGATTHCASAPNGGVYLALYTSENNELVMGMGQAGAHVIIEPVWVTLNLWF